MPRIRGIPRPRCGLGMTILVGSSIVRRRLRRIGEQRADLPHIVGARELLLDSREARVKTFAPADQVSARIFVRHAVAIAMRTLHLENLHAFDFRRSHGDALVNLGTAFPSLPRPKRSHAFLSLVGHHGATFLLSDQRYDDSVAPAEC